MIVGADGRVRVLDFGIARADQGPITPRAELGDSVGDGDTITTTGDRPLR